MMSAQLRTRVKVCGVTSRRDALLAVRLGADALGLQFYPKSPRYISVATAAEIAESLPPLVSTVGVFLDADEEAIGTVLESVPLNFLQFHGAETEAECSKWQVPYIKGIRVQSRDDIQLAAQQHRKATALLLDAFVANKPGGTGRTFDWSLIPALAKPFLLAGGLTSDNVAMAVLKAQPYGVDVCSGIESSPGIKSPQLLQAFMEEVRGVHSRPEEHGANQK